MAPPKFGDLGNSASELFDDDFTFGSVKAEVSTSTVSGIDLKTSAEHNTADNSLEAELQTKYAVKDYGMTITEKWKSSNLLVAELAIEDKLVKGLKSTLEASFQPNSGKKGAKLKNSFKSSALNASADLDFKSLMPILSTSAVIGYKDFFGGVSLGFDTDQQQLTKLSYGVEYRQPDFQLYGGVENGTNFSGSTYQQVSRKLETGVKFSWASNTHVTNFGVAAKYKLDEDSFVKVKADNNSIIGAAYGFKPNNSISVTLCASVDAKSINGGAHQLGAELAFEQ